VIIMSSTLKKITSVLASGALVASSTALASAPPPAPQATPAPQRQAADVRAQAADPWFMLGATSSSSTRAITMGGTNTAAQATDGSTAPNLLIPATPVIGGEVIGIGLWFALIVLALTSSGGNSRPVNSPTPNSPT
jgi:hypothetical protein